MKTIKIQDKEYKIKYSIRALFIFEAITKKPFKLETLLDNYVFLYAMLLASNGDNIIEWDAFLDELDSNPKLYQDLMEVLYNQEEKNKLFEEVAENNGEVSEDGQKKS